MITDIAELDKKMSLNFLFHLLERIFDRRIQHVLTFLVFFLYVTNYRIEHMQSWIDSYNVKLKPPSFYRGEGYGQMEVGSDSEFGPDANFNYSAQACKIPKLEMYSDTVKEYLKKNHKPLQNCEKKYPLLFNSTLEGEIVPARGAEAFAKNGFKECCYRVIVRHPKKDDRYQISNQCMNISLVNATNIPAPHEFIVIKCFKAVRGNQTNKRKPREYTMDMHAFVHVKPEVEKRLQKIKKLDGKEKVNVIVFGLDAVSRMNFLRTMPESYDFLMKKLNGLDMTGYNKVADNTFPNIMPMLSFLKANEVAAKCGKNKTYDNCPFIWKRYADQGYVTSFAEDAPEISIFNFQKRGFINQPTDYYLRPFSVAANRMVTHQIQVSTKLCYGPRLGFQVLLENMKKFVFQMSRRNRPFFQFTWATSLTHDYLHAPALGDRHLLRSLEWLEKEGHLNNTVFVLMSDHGQRVEAFRSTLQGQLEDRLPFMILVVPEWMRRGQFSAAYENLVGNRGRLVTTYDLHQTLSDILNLKQIENDLIIGRAHNLSQYAHPEKNLTMPRGISLFLPIPSKRTCVHASVDPIYCSCTYFRKIDIKEHARKVASHAVLKINSIVHPYEQCSSLQLKRVTMAQRNRNSARGGEFYLVNFETQPGDGMFEALVIREKSNRWTIGGAISRTNLYRNQSYCVHDSVIKLYCFCKEWKWGGTTEKNNVKVVQLKS